MPLCYDSLPGQLLALLQAGREVTVRWNCGNDEHLVDTQLDGVEQPFNLGDDYRDIIFAEEAVYEAYLATLTNLPLLLSGYLADYLRLPSVGEFSLQGDGRIFLADGAIMLEARSEAENWEYAPTPADWAPEYYLSPAELAELFPERWAAEVGSPGEIESRPDPAMAARYTGRWELFRVE